MTHDGTPFAALEKDNLKNYPLEALIPKEVLLEQIELLHKLYGLDIMITKRHGEIFLMTGDFSGFHPDVVENPGIKLKVLDHTVAHIYIKYDIHTQTDRQDIDRMVSNILEFCSEICEKNYLYKETSLYAAKLLEQLEKENLMLARVEKTDPLTGVYNETYFNNRMKIIDRAEVVPVCFVNFNINDWKFVADHYGEDESDRLILIVSNIIRKHAKQDYVIGRINQDIFYVIISMPKAQEVENYISAVKKECEQYEDLRLAPSVAAGIAVKENVEESLTDLISDAEYEMFEDKLRMKALPEYRNRLEKGLSL